MYMITGSGSAAIQQRFSYDASGKLVAVVYKVGSGTSYIYYYLRNAQGDVVKMIDSSGNTVVEYTYDSWGKIIATTGSLANTVGANQPFRYRGYVYDEETGWYYLQSRYYDPTTCRFISADVLLSTGQGLIGHNSFAYCLNDPTNMFDDGGTIARRINAWVLVKDDGGSSSKYIYDQEDPSIASLSFGKKGTVGNNGCGLVALYNVRVASGYRKSFKEFHKQMSGIPMMCLLWGRLGTNPASVTGALYGWFGNKNVYTKAKEVNGQFDAIIVLYVWRSKWSIGAHYYAAISIGNGRYIVYNDSVNGKTRIGNLSSVLNETDGWIIGFWGIYF